MQSEITTSLKESKYNDIGILLYSVMEILKEINKDNSKLYQLHVQYFEIYNENVFDLLGDVQ